MKIYSDIIDKKFDEKVQKVGIFEEDFEVFF